MAHRNRVPVCQLLKEVDRPGVVVGNVGLSLVRRRSAHKQAADWPF
ncbi:MAG TPA: hypothetical protein VEP69_02195 [Thermodesulfovibrionales bacterium]|nr:hypothetical protein [Thermodesulfovibrionales bacterium]